MRELMPVDGSCGEVVALACRRSARGTGPPGRPRPARSSMSTMLAARPRRGRRRRARPRPGSPSPTGDDVEAVRRQSARSSWSLSSATTSVARSRRRLASSSALVPWATILPRPIRIISSAIMLDLVEQVAGEQHRAAALGVPLEQAAHPADAGRVEAVGRLVEDQHRRVAEQRVGDAEPLPHAERVVADPALGLGRRRARPGLEHLVDARVGQAHRRAPSVEHLAAGAAGVLGRGVEQDADVAAGVGDVLEWRPPMVTSPRVAGSARPSPAWWWSCRRRWARGSR